MIQNLLLIPVLIKINYFFTNFEILYFLINLQIFLLVKRKIFIHLKLNYYYFYYLC
jgi:hypothetical protein